MTEWRVERPETSVTWQFTVHKTSGCVSPLITALVDCNHCSSLSAHHCHHSSLSGRPRSSLPSLITLWSPSLITAIAHHSHGRPRSSLSGRPRSSLPGHPRSSLPSSLSLACKFILCVPPCYFAKWPYSVCSHKTWPSPWHLFINEVSNASHLRCQMPVSFWIWDPLLWGVPWIIIV